MRKIVLILFFNILVSGCAVTKHEKSDESDFLINGKPADLLEIVKNENITKNSFFIKKVDLEVKTNEGKTRFICTVKFKKPEEYLISIKNIAGIEVIRMFLSEDSVFINDRMNRKLYKGSSRYLEMKYGINSSILPVVFGDIVSDSVIIDRNENKDLSISGIINGVLVKYFINRNLNKVSKAFSVYNYQNDTSILSFRKFHMFNNVVVPQYIEIEYINRNTIIKVYIKKIEIPWNGNLEFIPGNRYEIIDLK